MSEKIIRQLIDDLDGKPIDHRYGERIHFSYQGTNYRIDLRPTNADKFEAALQPFVEAAEKIANTRHGSRRTAAQATHDSPRSKEQNQKIRQWATMHGYAVGSRGRVKPEILRAFDAAH